MGKVVALRPVIRSDLPKSMQAEILDRWVERRQDTYDIAKAVGISEAAVYNCIGAAKRVLRSQQSEPTTWLD